jgi:hypothetical protein
MRAAFNTRAFCMLEHKFQSHLWPFDLSGSYLPDKNEGIPLLRLECSQAEFTHNDIE